MNRAVFHCPLLFSTLFISLPTFHQTVAQENTTPPVPTWISAMDKARVKRLGPWRESRFRYAAASHLMTDSTGAALEFRFRGSGIVLRLGSNAVLLESLLRGSGQEASALSWLLGDLERLRPPAASRWGIDGSYQPHAASSEARSAPSCSPDALRSVQSRTSRLLDPECNGPVNYPRR